MLKYHRALRSRTAFAVANAILTRVHPRFRSSFCPRIASSVSSWPRSSPPHPPFALPSHPTRFPPLAFDKVPDKLPDWWNDEDDEDDDPDTDGQKPSELQFTPMPGGTAGGGGDGSDGSGGGGGGGGGGNYNNSQPHGTDPDQHFLAALIAMYTAAIQRNPIRTKAISTALLAIIGDLVAQKIAQAQSHTFAWDRRRSASIATWAFCFMGPVLHYWYGALDRLFFGRYAVLYKLLSDQILFAPFFNASFLLGIGTLEGQPLPKVFRTVKEKIWPSMKANWTLWPAAQFINFAFVPKTFQIVYVNCVALLWNAIITYISHETKPTPHSPPQVQLTSSDQSTKLHP